MSDEPVKKEVNTIMLPTEQLLWELSKVTIEAFVDECCFDTTKGFVLKKTDVPTVDEIYARLFKEHDVDPKRIREGFRVRIKETITSYYNSLNLSTL